jgi:ABC-type phosphate/phosphonate transport system permease subunit
MSDDSRPDPIDITDMPVLRGERWYTLLLTVACLIFGVIVAIPVGAGLYSLNHPLTVGADNQVSWSFGAVAFPLALLVSGALLAGSVFILPLRIARRAGRVLDPTLWPAIGVYSLTVLLVIAFIAGIALRII